MCTYACRCKFGNKLLTLAARDMCNCSIVSEQCRYIRIYCTPSHEYPYYAPTLDERKNKPERVADHKYLPRLYRNTFKSRYKNTLKWYSKCVAVESRLPKHVLRKNDSIMRVNSKLDARVLKLYEYHFCSNENIKNDIFFIRKPKIQIYCICSIIIFYLSSK